MSNNFDEPLNIGGQNIGQIGYSMDCNGMPEFLRKLKNPSAMEKLREFYGIPELHKNNRQEYMKYRIDTKYHELLNNYFNSFFASQGFDFPDWDYGKEQEKWIEKNPNKGAGLDFTIPYEQFLKDNMKKNGVKEQPIENKQNNENIEMINFMKSVMEEIKEIKASLPPKPILIPNETKQNEGETSI